jgi:hypothetical protein
MLALIGATPIEHHPRQVGYLNLIPLYSDADFLGISELRGHPASKARLFFIYWT